MSFVRGLSYESHGLCLVHITSSCARKVASCVILFLRFHGFFFVDKMQLNELFPLFRVRLIDLF